MVLIDRRMERRNFIQTVSAISIVALAGCSSGDNTDSDDEGEKNVTDDVAPNMSLTYAYDEDTEELEVTVDAIDMSDIEAQNLYLGEDIGMYWSDLPSYSRGDTVSAGDSFTVEVSPDATVPIIYETEDAADRLDEVVVGNI